MEVVALMREGGGVAGGGAEEKWNVPLQGVRL